MTDAVTTEKSEAVPFIAWLRTKAIQLDAKHEILELFDKAADYVKTYIDKNDPRLKVP